ncbi:huntingtin-interacting protein K isoform X2 [Cavia porcellus]|uniref:huntingtin-interacting protein K isoform X2 n=1 Tax=Cavia porcellus TaxID=10141 RepID=UPI002FE36B77
MATEGDVELELETETSCPERPPEKPRKHDSGAADLERVTDYAEEKEIQSSNLETAMSVIGDRRSREQKARQERCQRWRFPEQLRKGACGSTWATWWRLSLP